MVKQHPLDPSQQSLTVDDEPIAPLHNVAVDLAVLKGQASRLKESIDVVKDRLVELMDKYDIQSYSCRGITITVEDKITVKVSAGVEKVEASEPVTH